VQGTNHAHVGHAIQFIQFFPVQAAGESDFRPAIRRFFQQPIKISISTQLDSLIPASKISNLTQGMFVGSVSDNFDERIEQKIFHAEIVVDNAAVARETKTYRPIPVITNFIDEDGTDRMQEQIEKNYNQIKEDVKLIVTEEFKRISEDENLKHLIKKE
jgi:hypothetical protein